MAVVVHVDVVGELVLQPVAGQPVADADEGDAVLGRHGPQQRVHLGAPAAAVSGALAERAHHGEFGTRVALLQGGDQALGVGGDLLVAGSLLGVVPAAFDDDERRKAVGQVPVAPLQGIDVVARGPVGGHKARSPLAAEENVVAESRQGAARPACLRLGLRVTDQQGRAANIVDDDFVPAVGRVAEEGTRRQAGRIHCGEVAGGRRTGGDGLARCCRGRRSSAGYRWAARAGSGLGRQPARTQQQGGGNDRGNQDSPR